MLALGSRAHIQLHEGINIVITCGPQSCTTEKAANTTPSSRSRSGKSFTITFRSRCRCPDYRVTFTLAADKKTCFRTQEHATVSCHSDSGLSRPCDCVKLMRSLCRYAWVGSCFTNNVDDSRAAEHCCYRRTPEFPVGFGMIRTPLPLLSHRCIAPFEKCTLVTLVPKVPFAKRRLTF